MTMRVVHLADGDNFIEAGHQRYIVARDAAGVWHTIADKCPHRGGPLHLGAVDSSGEFVVCPWHHNKTRVTHLIAKGLPTVRGGDHVSVVVGTGGEEAHPLQRTMLLDCSAALARDPSPRVRGEGARRAEEGQP